MKTLQDQWKNYRDKVYPKDIPAEQNRECHQAFMAGAFIALSEVVMLSNCPDTDQDEATAESSIGQLVQEAEQWMRLRGVALNQPRN